MRKLLFAFLTLALAPRARGATVYPVENSGFEWASSEGVSLKLGAGVNAYFDSGLWLGLGHAFDVYKPEDPLHHWEIRGGETLNGVYAGVRYHDSRRLEEFEAGVSLGNYMTSIALGAVYDQPEKRLAAVTMRISVPILLFPVLLYNSYKAEQSSD